MDCKLYTPIEFNDKTHEYFYEKKRIPSVTQILAPISKVLYEKVEIATLRNKAKIGSQVHKLIERYSKYGLIPNKETTDERVYSYFQQYLNWNNECEDNVIFENEFKGIYLNGNMAFAGTIDNIRMLGNDLVLIDYKTVANPNRFILSLQLYGYRLIAEQMLGVKINRFYALLLKTDSYEFEEMTLEVTSDKIKEEWELLYKLNEMLEFNGVRASAKKYDEGDF